MEHKRRILKTEVIRSIGFGVLDYEKSKNNDLEFSNRHVYQATQLLQTASIHDVEYEDKGNAIIVYITMARPGYFIGLGGDRVAHVSKFMEKQLRVDHVVIQANSSELNDILYSFQHINDDVLEFT